MISLTSTISSIASLWIVLVIVLLDRIQAVFGVWWAVLERELGPASNQLNNPRSLSFDRDGNILLWRNGNVNPPTILAYVLSPISLFVTDNDQIFASVDNGYPNTRVERWALNGTRLPPLLSSCSRCFGLFVDINNNLYCSQFDRAQVVRKSLNSLDNTLTIVAGTGCAESASNMLDRPYGIFVTTQLDLYVADYGNDRVQLFRSGEMNATTVAGNGSIGSVALCGPAGVVLDADGYLFIVDSLHNRVVGSGPGGFRCVVGCSGTRGPASNQLNNPRSLSFDRDGNIFVADTSNNRIQKFLLLHNSLGK